MPARGVSSAVKSSYPLVRLGSGEQASRSDQKNDENDHDRQRGRKLAWCPFDRECLELAEQEARTMRLIERQLDDVEITFFEPNEHDHLPN